MKKLLYLVVIFGCFFQLSAQENFWHDFAIEKGKPKRDPYLVKIFDHFKVDDFGFDDFYDRFRIFLFSVVTKEVKGIVKDRTEEVLTAGDTSQIYINIRECINNIKKLFPYKEEAERAIKEISKLKDEIEGLSAEIKELPDKVSLLGNQYANLEAIEKDLKKPVKDRVFTEQKNQELLELYEKKFSIIPNDGDNVSERITILKTKFEGESTQLAAELKKKKQELQDKPNELRVLKEQAKDVVSKNVRENFKQNIVNISEYVATFTQDDPNEFQDLSDKSKTPLALSLSKNNFEAFLVLLHHPKIEVNKKFQSYQFDRTIMTPLHYIVRGRDINWLKAILKDHKVDLSITNDWSKYIVGGSTKEKDFVPKNPLDYWIDHNLGKTSVQLNDIANSEDKALLLLRHKAKVSDAYWEEKLSKAFEDKKHFDNDEAKAYMYRLLTSMSNAGISKQQVNLDALVEKYKGKKEFKALKAKVPKTSSTRVTKKKLIIDKLKTNITKLKEKISLLLIEFKKLTV